MRHFNFIQKASISLLAFYLFACGENKDTLYKENTPESPVHIGKGETFIQNENAKTFLPSWKKENTLVVHMIGEPNDMHPTNGTSDGRTFINQYTQGFILATDPKGLDIRPGIVKSNPIVSEDGLSYTYELRDEPTWDDGSPLSVDDIIFTFKANKCPLVNNPQAKPYLDPLKDIKKDPTNIRKFTLVMKRKYIQNVIFVTDYPLLQRSYFDPKNILANYSFAQLDDPKSNFNTAKDLKEWASEFNSPKYSREVGFLAGLGAYKWADWKPQQSMTLIRKKNHWTNKVANPSEYETSYPEKIIFKINTDANSQLLEFKTQAMDVSTYLSIQTLVNLQKDSNFNTNYHSKFTDTYNYSYIGMNTRPDGIKHKKLFTDKKVRRAMAMLTPVDDINLVINMGKNTRIAGPVSPLKEECNKDLRLIEFDIEGAKKLLAQAGWIDTDRDNIRDKIIDGEKVKFEFDFSYLSSQVQSKDIALMISEAMYKAGVKANLKPNEFSVHYENAKNHTFDMMLGGWGGSSLPEDFDQIWSTNSWSTKGSNYTGFGSAESDKLIEELKYTLEKEKRKELTYKLQSIIYEEQPYIFLYSQTRRNVIHKRFGNAIMTFERPGVLLNNLQLLNSASVQ